MLRTISIQLTRTIDRQLRLAGIFFIRAELSLGAQVGQVGPSSITKWIFISPAPLQFACVGLRVAISRSVAIGPELIRAHLKSVVGHAAVAALVDAACIDVGRCPGQENECEG